MHVEPTRPLTKQHDLLVSADRLAPLGAAECLKVVESGHSHITCSRRKRATEHAFDESVSQRVRNGAKSNNLIRSFSAHVST